MARTERAPKASDVVLPVYVPSENGVTRIELAKATMRNGTMIVEFKNNLPGVAIQKIIERGVVLGLSFVMIAPDAVNLAAQEKLAHEEELDELEERYDESNGPDPRIGISIDDAVANEQYTKEQEQTDE